MMEGVEIEDVLAAVMEGVAVCTALKVDIEDATGIALMVEKDEVADDKAVELSILRLLGLTSGSGVGVLVGVSSN